MTNQNKTKPTNTDVEMFLDEVVDVRQEDSRELIDMMREVSGEAPVMWGKSIIGFGSYHYRYASGREGDWMKIGFSPRKTAFSLYLSCDASEYADELAELGNATHGKGCIYFKGLNDIDRDVLRRMLDKAYKATNNYGAH